MQITASQLYAHAAGLKQLFSYKTKKSLDLTRLSTISKGIFDSLPYRERVQRIPRMQQPNNNIRQRRRISRARPNTRDR